VVNDVSALTRDAEMAAVVRRARAGVVLMHMRGTPRTMQAAPRYTDVVEEVSRYLAARCAELTDRGLDARQLAVDPGIGFGKTADHNLQLLAHLHRVAACGRPVVIGLSRKSFLGTLTGHPVAERLAASVAALTFCVLGGAHVVRVHDVAAAWDAVRVALALARARRGEPGGVEQS
jgi:dihydropteroate synthase